jgi:hypothetical protein
MTPSTAARKVKAPAKAEAPTFDLAVHHLGRIAYALEILAGIDPEEPSAEPDSPRKPLSAADAALLPLVSLVAKELVKTHDGLPGQHKIRAALAAVGIRVGTHRAGDLARAALQELTA